MTSLGKIINMLRDLEKLAYDHHIEEYLYFGDGLIKVYQIEEQQNFLQPFVTTTSRNSRRGEN